MIWMRTLILIFSLLVLGHRAYASVSLGNGVEYVSPTKSIGIGYLSPGEKLAVNGDILASANLRAESIIVGGTTLSDVYTDGGRTAGANSTLGNLDDYKLSLITNGNAALTIDDNGNVGIGDSTPDYFLDVAGTLGVDGAATLASTLAVTGATTLSSTLATGSTTVTGTLSASGAGTMDSAAIGGGYGSTGASISNAGVVQADGAVTLGSTLDVSGNTTIGGGYGSTGVTISSAGALQADGAVTLGSTLALTGAATMAGGLTFSGSSANILLGSNYLSGDGGDEGIAVDSSGCVTISGTATTEKLTVGGATAAIAFKEGNAPTATAGYGKLYVKSSDSNLYFMNDSGNETQLTRTDGPANIDALTDAIHDTATTYNLFLGSSSGLNVAAGGLYNTAYGYEAYKAAAASSGDNNTAIGYQSMYSNDTGSENTAAGYKSLYSNTSGNYNTAIGYNALYSNTIGNGNTAAGYEAMYSNVDGNWNSAMGAQVMYANVSGIYNSALGYQTLYNSTGSYNTAIGAKAFYTQTSGDYNTGIGFNAGYAMTTGDNNILIGTKAGENITSGSSNIIIGYDIDAPSATGSNQLVIANLIYGTNVDGTGTTLSTGNVGIGNSSPSSKLHVTGNNDDVLLLSDGADCEAQPDTGSLSWSCSSDVRLKTNIRPASELLDYLMRFELKEFTFNPTRKESFGVIAQEVQNIDPKLVTKGEDGYLRVSELNQWQLVKALQELQTIQDQQKNKLKSHTEKISQLLAKIKKLKEEASE